MPTPTPPRRVPCWASTQSQPCWTGGLLERLKGLSPGHGKQRRHWATSWLVCSASWGSEFHGATCSPGVGGRPEDVHTTDLESPVCPHTWACPLADSSSSGNGMCSSICLTLLVKDLSHPSLSLSLSLRVLPVLSLSLSPCLCLSMSVCLSLTSLILYWPLISSSFLFGCCLDSIIFTSFYCTIFSVSLYRTSAVHYVLRGCKILLPQWGHPQLPRRWQGFWFPWWPSG